MAKTENIDSSLLNTNSQIMNALKNIVRGNPKQCILHTKDLQDLKEGFKSLSNQVKEIADGQKETHRKLFITNGDICMSENIRNVKGVVTRHLEEHVKKDTNKKWNVGTVIAITAVIISALAMIITSYNSNKEKTNLNTVKYEIINALKKP